jgi:hypothetical protein
VGDKNARALKFPEKKFHSKKFGRNKTGWSAFGSGVFLLVFGGKK